MLMTLWMFLGGLLIAATWAADLHLRLCSLTPALGRRIALLLLVAGILPAWVVLGATIIVAEYLSTRKLGDAGRALDDLIHEFSTFFMEAWRGR